MFPRASVGYQTLLDAVDDFTASLQHPPWVQGTRTGMALERCGIFSVEGGDRRQKIQHGSRSCKGYPLLSGLLLLHNQLLTQSRTWLKRSQQWINHETWAVEPGALRLRNRTGAGHALSFKFILTSQSGLRLLAWSYSQVNKSIWCEGSGSADEGSHVLKYYRLTVTAKESSGKIKVGRQIWGQWSSMIRFNET